MKIKLFIFLILIFFHCFSQKEVYNWHFGTYAGLNFSISPPSATTSTVLAGEGTSSISDANGNLLFYTNGMTVWNRFHQVMANGTGLISNQSSTQAALIIKQPGNTNIYFIITTYTQTFYSVVDMNLAAGNGSVTTKNIMLHSSATEKLAGVRHCNGIDTWFVIHERSTNNFVSYLVSSTGIGLPVYSPAGTTFIAYGAGLDEGSLGQMKISPSGKKLGLTYPGFNSSGSYFAIADFNNSTGVVSNYLQLAVLPVNGRPAYGCEFSPDGSKFYGSVIGYTNTTSGATYQWDLSAGSTPAIISSLYTLNTPTVYCPGGMQLAPDGKIYIAPGWGTNFLSAIANPNLSGAACNFVLNAVSIVTANNTFSMPNFVSSLIKVPFSYSQGANCNSSVTFTPPSGVTTSGISWNFGDLGSGPANTSTLSNPTHTYPTSGSYSVIAVVSFSGCIADTIRQVISISDITLSVSQQSATCDGLGTATISVLPSQGSYIYSWTPSVNNTSITSNLSPGLYTISVTASTMLCTKQQTVLINPITISGVVSHTAHCKTGDAGINMINGSGNYTYFWSSGSQTTQIVSALNPGYYTVVISDILNQCSLTNTLQVTTLPAPNLVIAGDIFICKGESTTLTVAGADTYSWNQGGTNSLVVVSPTSTITYSVTGTFTQNTCSSNSTVVTTVAPCLSITESAENDQEFYLYPNPSATEIVIKSTLNMKFSIYNELGQVVTSGELIKGKNSIKLNDLPTGVYIIRADVQENLRTFRFIKQE